MDWGHPLEEDGTRDDLMQIVACRDTVDQFMHGLFWLLKCASYDPREGSLKDDPEVRAELFRIIKPIVAAELISVAEGNDRSHVDAFLNKLFRAVVGHVAGAFDND